MFRTEELLDLRECPFPEVFDGVGFAWEVLKRLPEFVRSRSKPAQLGTVIGTPFIGKDVFIGKGTVVEAGAVIKGPALIGENCEIRANAYIRENVIVGNECVLGNACEFKNSILFNGSQVPHFSYVGDSVLGARAHLGAGVILSNVKAFKGSVTVEWQAEKIDTQLRKFGAILGDGADVGCNCVLAPGSIIGRNSVLYPNVLWRGFCPPGSLVKLRQEHEIVLRRP